MNKNKLRVMTIVGTRPEIIKLSRVISELDIYSDHILVHTGQNYDYELNQVFFDELKIRKPDEFLEASSDNTAKTIGNIIAYSDNILEKYNPDAVLIYGDTNSCLSAISAKRRKIPIFHMEAGNRCFDQRVPEEINRKIVDHLSDINMPISDHAKRYLESEGIPSQRIVKIGSSMKEIFNHYKEEIKNSQVLNKLKLNENDYFIVSFHREENVDNQLNFEKIISVLDEIEKKYKKKIIVSTHPRTRKKIKSINTNNNIKFLKPFGFFDYVKLQIKAYCVISDSGTISEESSILGFPAITIRESHERPEAMDEGTLIMSGLSLKNILNSIDISVKYSEKNIKPKIVYDYNSDNISSKVIKIIYSYTDYVNENVWKK